MAEITEQLLDEIGHLIRLSDDMGEQWCLDRQTMEIVMEADPDDERFLLIPSGQGNVGRLSAFARSLTDAALADAAPFGG